MNYYALIVVIVCCVAWMTRPGLRPHAVVLDLLPWLCVAGFVVDDGALGAVMAWTAIPLIYFSIKYNRLESLATPAQQGGTIDGTT
jgi:hypothetical protein